MGINCLFPFLKKFPGIFQHKNLREFSGKIAAVDASCWIHKALYNSIREGGNRNRFKEFFQKSLEVVLDAGVCPWMVFDGLKLPAKEENRRRERLRANQAERLANTEEENNRLLANSASIQYEDVVQCIEVCRSQHVNYIVAPYEADAQISYLVRNGIADFAITEDSDLLAYGCTHVFAKMNNRGVGECYSIATVCDKLGLHYCKFLDLCILAGCDFLKNIKGIGIHTAYKKLQAQPTSDV